MTAFGGHVYDEVLFTVDKAKATEVERVDLSELDLQERAHLQEWILANPRVLGQDVTIIASEYDRWQTATGDPVLDRLDILRLDPSGRLVVTELKRGAAPHTIHMQAINYAAMVSRLKPEDVADLYAKTQSARGNNMDAESTLADLTTNRLLSTDSVRHPRIVLVASDFPASVTAAVVWLNEQGVDIFLIRFRAYRLNDHVVVSFSRLFPVPDVEDFTIGRRTDQSTSISVEPGESVGRCRTRPSSRAGQSDDVGAPRSLRRGERRARRRRRGGKPCWGHRQLCAGAVGAPHDAPEEPQVRVPAEDLTGQHRVAAWRGSQLHPRQRALRTLEGDPAAGRGRRRLDPERRTWRGPAALMMCIPLPCRPSSCAWKGLLTK